MLPTWHLRLAGLLLLNELMKNAAIKYVLARSLYAAENLSSSVFIVTNMSFRLKYSLFFL